MATIVHFPDFMYNNLDLKKGNFFKLIYFLAGLIVGFIHKNTNKKLFCFFMNIFFRKESKIYYKNDLYFKNLENRTISFPNKRIDRVIINYKKHFNDLLETYCVSDLMLEEDDTVVDCGSNVGELFYALKINNSHFNYYGFEPDPITYRSLHENLKNTSSEIFDYALSNENGQANLYLDSEGADSSLVYFGKVKNYSVETRTLDSFKLEKIKLFKLEAEGFEYEVLEGAKNTLKNTDLVTVDYGPEKGLEKNTTASEVTNFLYKNDFKLIKTSKYRHVGLFKNKNF
tara:strand:+ start:4166 stop:5023 length:858 start_codon:yes stop_codon:yes gene_type:complete